MGDMEFEDSLAPSEGDPPAPGSASIGLNRLLKMAEFQAKTLKSIPQGLKPALIPLPLCRG
jgi:hypothetical protein